MEYTVKSVEAVEAKSTQEIEEALLAKHKEESDAASAKEEGNAVGEGNKDVGVKEDLTEESVLSFLSKKYGRDVDSLDELNATRESQKLPEDVEAYFKYKKETGRGIEDYVKLNKDFDKSDENTLLKDYYASTEEGLDDEDIQFIMDEFVYDEYNDDESEIKKIKIAKKKAVNKAKKYFNEQKEKYKAPLESGGSSISESESKDIESYKQYMESSKTYEEEVQKKRDWFTKKTDDVFGSEFKGFEFTLDDKKIIYSPGDATELKKLQSDPQNFISKFIGESGLMQDVVGYHKALSMAMNPDKVAKFFYEQGKSEATDDIMRKTKNINMSDRKSPEVTSKGGTQFKSLNNDSGRGLKIRSRNKN